MKKFFSHNIWLKVLALVFSFALWFFVGGQREAQVGFLIIPDITGVPQGMLMVGDSSERVEVRLTGPQGFINNLSPAQVKVSLDLSEAGEGLNSFRLEPYDVEVPRGIKVLNINPNSYAITMERLTSVILPVRVNFAGTPAKGFKAISLVAEPQEVEVSGRKEVIKKLKRVYTKLIDIEGFDSTRVLRVALQLSENLRDASFESVDVKIIIEKKDKD